MTGSQRPLDEVLRALQERAKELECLYRIDELLGQPGVPWPEMMAGIIRAMPSAWQYPAICQARLAIHGTVVETPDFRVTPWGQAAPIRVEDERVGVLEVFYREETVHSADGPFLKEE